MKTNLIHDDEKVVAFFDAVDTAQIGYNGTLYTLEQFTTKAAAIARVASLGLEHDTDANGDPTPPKDIAS